MESKMEQIARTPKQIGGVVRRYRRKLGINQTSIGQKTGLRQATISAFEAGEPGTQISTICDVMAALHLEFVIRPRTAASADEIEDIF
jgi:HTH-type transcriptional regulator / antitoxin HipB